MSLEAAIAELTAAVRENTAAHNKLAEVAKAATGKTTTEAPKPAPETKAEEPSEDKEAQKKAAAEKKAASEKRKAEKEAKEKAEAEAAAKADAAADEADDEATDLPEIVASVDSAGALAAASAFLNPKDASKRDENKANMQAAFAHLGVTRLGGLESDEDRARFVAYLAYWTAGLSVDFEEVDERLASLDGATDADDLLS